MSIQPVPPERQSGSDPLCRSVLDRVAAGAAVITTAGMIATPLLPQAGRGRRWLSSVVVTAMFTTTTANATRRWGTGRAVGAATLTATATAAVERVGTRTGIPFGRYSYTSALRPQIAHVPVIVPLAWFGMGLPSREAAHAALGARSTPTGRVLLGSAAMTAWDLFLDPQMVGEGYWAWARRGRYRGIPLSNFVGWFVTGLGIMAALEALLPPRHATEATTGNTATTVTDATTVTVSGSSDADATRPRPSPVGDARLIGEYGFMSVMQTLGFARFFRDPLVAAVGGAAMLPIAAAATVNRMRGTR
ncbi:MAG: carotenoid biosynthesis protein [Ilumatobacter sp.]|uniref:carotenoid biosynthesis protein n=1 Tax=Ilumatobacter sp. TaxID=1967498 RepID=UPI003919DE6A